jgi:hypothetical protein
MLSLTLPALLFFTHAASATGAPRCTLMIIEGVRPGNAAQLVLKATPDSVSDGSWFPVFGDPKRVPQHQGQVPRIVFGQVFDVVSESGLSAGMLSGARRVVIVWWEVTASCTRWFPLASLNQNVTDLFLPLKPRDGRRPPDELEYFRVGELRPREEWVSGLPTIDVAPGSLWYSPTARLPVNLEPPITRPMTVPEYLELYARLPVIGGDRTAWVESNARLLAWGDSLPELWRLHPSASVLCMALQNSVSNPNPRLCRGR